MQKLQENTETKERRSTSPDPPRARVRMLGNPAVLSVQSGMLTAAVHARRLQQVPVASWGDFSPRCVAAGAV